MKKRSRLFYASTLFAAMLAIATMGYGVYHPPAVNAQSSVRYDDLPDAAEFVGSTAFWPTRSFPRRTAARLPETHTLTRTRRGL